MLNLILICKFLEISRKLHVYIILVPGLMLQIQIPSAVKRKVIMAKSSVKKHSLIIAPRFYFVLFFSENMKKHQLYLHVPPCTCPFFGNIPSIKTLVVHLTSEYVNNLINMEFNKFLDFTMFSKAFYYQYLKSVVLQQ